MTPIRSSSAGRGAEGAARRGGVRPRAAAATAAGVATAGVAAGVVAVVLHAQAPGGTPVGTDAAAMWIALACGAIALGAGIAGIGGRAATSSLLLAWGAAVWPLTLWGVASFLSAPALLIWALAGAGSVPLVAAAGLHGSRRGGSLVERALLLTLLVTCLSSTLAPALLTDPSLHGCFRCAPNPLAIADDPALARSLARVALALSAFATGALALIAVTRGVSALRAGRRARPLILVPTALWLLTACLRSAVAAIHEVQSFPLHPALIASSAFALLAIAIAALWIRARAIGARDDAAAFLAELSTAPRDVGARELLARTLGDPELTIGFPQPDGAVIDAKGDRVIDAPGMGRTELRRNGESVAVLEHRPQLLDEPDRIEQAAAGAWLAIEADRSAAELEHRERELREARIRLVAASDDERRHLFRDLHDGVQPRLVALALRLEVLRMTIADDAARRLIDSAREELAGAVSELRRVAALTWSTLLAERGLAAAIRGLDETVPWRVELMEPSVSFDAPVESAVYSVAAAAGALGPVTVRTHSDATTSVAEIDCGTTPKGISALADRVEGVGGRLQIIELPGGAAQLRLDFVRAASDGPVSETVAR